MCLKAISHTDGLQSLDGQRRATLAYSETVDDGVDLCQPASSNRNRFVEYSYVAYTAIHSPLAVSIHYTPHNDTTHSGQSSTHSASLYQQHSIAQPSQPSQPPFSSTVAHDDAALFSLLLPTSISFSFSTATGSLPASSSSS